MRMPGSDVGLSQSKEQGLHLNRSKSRSQDHHLQRVLTRVLTAAADRRALRGSWAGQKAGYLEMGVR